MSPFQRLGLFAASAAVFGAIAALGMFVSWHLAAAAGVGGAMGACVAAFELAPRSPAVSAPAADAAGEPGASPDFAIRRRERREIARDAERAREAEEA